MSRLFFRLPAVLIVFFAACSEETNGRGGGSDGTDSDQATDSSSSDADSDADTDADTDGDSDADSDSDSDGDTDPDTGIDTEFNPDVTPGDSNNADRKDRLTCIYEDGGDLDSDPDTFNGTITVGNANTDYVWNGHIFTIYSVDFLTTSTITEAKTSDWIAINHSRVNDETVRFDFGWMSVFEQGDLITFNVTGTRSGLFPFPARCSPNYIRGDVVYPEYQDLPHSFWKNKETLDVDDLIHDTDDYYREDADPTTEAIFVYHPTHNTQINIGLPEQMTDIFDDNPAGDDLLVSGYTDIRMFMPSKMLAMGIGFAYQWFKFNPNYFLGLGTKENFACGLIPKATWAGGYPITLGGEDYSWYYTLSPDGPFQQETGNFTDMARFFPDYFPPTSSHDSYTNVTDPMNEMDPKWATSVVSSALSSVVTRETLWGSLGDKYKQMVFEAKDPWAELSIITYAYNRGIYGFCALGLFSDMDRLLNSTDVNSEYGLDGVGDHVPQINGITANCNAAVDQLYDVQLTWSDVEAFFEAIHFIYGQGDPTDEEWAAMLADVQASFNVLKAHWGGDTISYRFDFLTLMRVAQKHLPNPTNVRPTSDWWKDRVTQLGPC